MRPCEAPHQISTVFEDNQRTQSLHLNKIISRDGIHTPIYNFSGERQPVALWDIWKNYSNLFKAFVTGRKIGVSTASRFVENILDAFLDRCRHVKKRKWRNWRHHLNVTRETRVIGGGVWDSGCKGRSRNSMGCLRKVLWGSEERFYHKYPPCFMRKRVSKNLYFVT